MIRENKHTLIITSIIGVMAWSGLLFSNSRAGRKPASLDPQTLKEQRLAAGPKKSLPVLSKGHSMLDVVISAPGKGAIAKGSTINLEATITARTKLQGLRYLWLLPKDGVSAVAGAIEGQIDDLTAADTSKLQLSIRSDTDENRKVHLHVYRVVNGENMGQMAQYNTVDQEAIEWVAKDKAETLMREAEARGGVSHKIYQ